MAVIGLLSMSDRAPHAIEAALDLVREGGRAIESRFGVDWVDLSDVPFGYDTVGHFGLWAAAGWLGYAAIGRRLGGFYLALCLFTMSAGIEIGQALLSSTRSPSASDLAANGVGIALGVLVGAIAARMAGRPRRVLA